MKSNNLNDLFDYGYMIYQNDDYFKFSLDSVLLAEFVKVRKNNHKILDMCSGNFPIPMILHKKYQDKVDITAIEIQKVIYEMGIESLNYNKIKNIKTINDDIKNYVICNKSKKYDIITCNPPYFIKHESDFVSENEIKSIARHEIKINLEEIIDSASKLLKNQGYLYMVHRPQRLADIISTLNKYKFGVKKIQPIANDEKAKCSLILIEAIYNGKDYVSLENTLYLNKYNSYQNIFEEE